MHRHGDRGHQGGVGQLITLEENRRSTSEQSAVTTSFTVTVNRFLIFLMSSRSNSVNATLRPRVTVSLNSVRGARKGTAIVRPLRARRTRSTTVDTVIGTMRVMARRHAEKRRVSFRNADDEALLVARSAPCRPRNGSECHTQIVSRSACATLMAPSLGRQRDTRPHPKTYAAEVLICHGGLSWRRRQGM